MEFNGIELSFLKKDGIRLQAEDPMAGKRWR